MVINSLDNNKIKDIRKLKQNKYMEENNKFIIEGYHLVEEAKKAGILDEVLKLENVKTIYTKDDIIVSLNVMKSISNLSSTPDVIGVCNYIEDKNNIGNKVIILDGVQDPGNLGTIIRSAVAFNYDTIVLSLDSVKKYNEKVIRATQGMIFKINIITRDLKPFIECLKNDNYKVYATDVNNGISLKNVNRVDKFAFILGSEGQGVKEEIKSLVDDNIYIDMNKECESLNVAVAGAIIMYELNK